MKAHQIISLIDEARYGRGLGEDKAPVAAAPSHAPTSTAQWKTPTSGKSKDEGSRTGGEKDAIKKSDTAIPAPVAKAPSHAPTSTAQWKTKGEATSDDEGEKISKEAMKESTLINRILNAEDATDIEAILAEAELSEGRHKPGCKCGFCANMEKLRKKPETDDDDDDDGKAGKNPEKSIHDSILRWPVHDVALEMFGKGYDDLTDEQKKRVMAKCKKQADQWRREEKSDNEIHDALMSGGLPGRRPSLRSPDRFGGPAKTGSTIHGKIGKPVPAAGGRMGFRHPSSATPRPKGAMAPYQPRMGLEHLDRASSAKAAIQEIADDLLEAPE